MGRVEETVLPGVGVRFSFTTSDNRHVSVLHHHSGRRELFVSDPGDPDRAIQVLELSEEDGRTLAELLGTSQVAREVQRVQQHLEGLAIEWLRVAADGPAAGRTIGQLQVRGITGATIIAVLRAGEALASPGPSLALEPGDTVIVCGSPDAVLRAHDLLRGD